MMGQIKYAAKKVAVRAKTMRAKFFDIGASVGPASWPARRNWLPRLVFQARHAQGPFSSCILTNQNRMNDYSY